MARFHGADLLHAERRPASGARRRLGIRRARAASYSRRRPPPLAGAAAEASARWTDPLATRLVGMADDDIGPVPGDPEEYRRIAMDMRGMEADVQLALRLVVSGHELAMHHLAPAGHHATRPLTATGSQAPHSPDQAPLEGLDDLLARYEKRRRQLIDKSLTALAADRAHLRRAAAAIDPAHQQHHEPVDDAADDS